MLLKSRLAVIAADFGAKTCSLKFFRARAGWNVACGTEPNVVPLHAAAKCARTRELRGPSLGVVGQGALVSLPSVQAGTDIGSCRYELGEAEGIHHGEAGTLREGRRHRMGCIANDGDATHRPCVEVGCLVHVVAAARADHRYCRTKLREDARPHVGING